jgi:hypothetical protein
MREISGCMWAGARIRELAPGLRLWFQFYCLPLQKCLRTMAQVLLAFSARRTNSASAVQLTGITELCGFQK